MLSSIDKTLSFIIEKFKILVTCASTHFKPHCEDRLVSTSPLFLFSQNDIIQELETYDPGRSWLSFLADDQVTNYKTQRRTKRSVTGLVNWYGTSTAHDVFEVRIYTQWTS